MCVLSEQETRLNTDSWVQWWLWTEVYNCDGVCVGGNSRLHSNNHWLL